jgi:AAA domain
MTDWKQVARDAWDAPSWRRAALEYSGNLHRPEFTMADNQSSEQKSAEDCAAAQKGQPLSIADFLAKELPERKNIIDPWLPEKGLGMIYSPRGVGKTLFGLGSGYAISAAETFLGFEVEAPQKVLYVDGEMPARVMQERLAAIVRGFGKQPPSENHFRLLCADLFEFGLPDLATPAGKLGLTRALATPT